METKNIINFLIVSIVIVLIIIGFKTAERINKEYSQQKGGDFIRINDDEQGLPQAKPGDSGGSAEEGGSLEESGGARESAEIGNRTDLPSDISTKPCSFYFSEYGVCAGTCPTGTCQQTGKSCYCR